MYPTFKFDKEITVLETFAGIGSQRKALDRLAKKYDLKINYLPPIEIDKYAIASYNAIHGTNHRTKDITKTKGSEYGKIDLLTYSFPCQDISIAGKQAGFSKGSGTRSGLLWEVERILKEMKYLPKVLLMENVRNLVSEKHMPDFQEWIKELERLGYSNYWKILNAKDYGIPQNRERVFMVSILGKYNYTFPQPEPLKLRLKDMLEDKVDEKYYLNVELLKTLDVEDYVKKVSKTIRTSGHENTDQHEYDLATVTTNETLCINSKVNGKQPSLQDRIYDSNGISTAIATGFMPSILETPVIAASRGRNKDNPSARIAGIDLEQRLEINSQGLCNTLTTVQKDNYVVEPVIEVFDYRYDEGVRTRENQDIIPTLTTQVGSSGLSGQPLLKILENTKKEHGEVENENVVIIVDSLNRAYVYDKKTKRLFRIRKLTPLECFRFMGFDDEDYYKAAKVNSNTQLYKQCGNSIVVNVLEKIFEMMI